MNASDSLVFLHTAAANETTFAALMAEMAPDVPLRHVIDEAALQEAVAMGVLAADVSPGRLIYIDNCARCHRPEAVTRYTETQWQKILPWMSDQAQQSPEDAAAVKAYVLITLRAAARVTDDNARTPATTAPADP